MKVPAYVARSLCFEQAQTVKTLVFEAGNGERDRPSIGGPG